MGQPGCFKQCLTDGYGSETEPRDPTVVELGDCNQSREKRLLGQSVNWTTEERDREEKCTRKDSGDRGEH